VLVALQHRGLVLELDVERVDQHDGGFLAGVVAALVDGEAEQVGGGDAQARNDGGRQFVFRVVQRKLEFVQSQHGGFPAGDRAP
jgi:hypothetical protein